MPSKHAGRQRTIRLDDDENALLEALGPKHGGIKGAVVAGLRMLDGANDIDLPAALERAAAELRKLDKAKSRFGSKKTAE